MYRKLGLLSIPIGVLAVLAFSLLAGSGSAQPGGVGGTSIRTDRNQYRVNDPVTICYTIPPGRTPITIVNQFPDGREVTILQGVDDGTGGCIQSVVIPPVGTHCYRITVLAPGSDGSFLPAGSVGALTARPGPAGEASACVRVQEALGPLPPPGTGIALTTDRRTYTDGDPVQVCYTVPVAGAIVVSDMLPNGQAVTVFAGDTGAGTTCLAPGLVVAGPGAGTECIRVDAYLSRGASLYGSKQVCFTVTARLNPLPGPAGVRLNKQQFRVGELVQVCYSPPAAGHVILSLVGPTGAGSRFVEGDDNGTGGCTVVQATLPFGRWCVNFAWTAPGVPRPAGAIPVGQFNSQACYQVIGAG